MQGMAGGMTGGMSGMPQMGTAGMMQQNPQGTGMYNMSGMGGATNTGGYMPQQMSQVTCSHFYFNFSMRKKAKNFCYLI